MRTIAGLTLLLALPFSMIAQPKGDIGVDSPRASGSLIIHESSRIEGLMKDYAARKRPLSGYRVQIFLGRREQAEDVRRAFLLKHPEVPAYLSYLAPNFRVRVGDQRDRITAERLREELRTEFPGLYVVPDEIEWPRLPETTP